MDQEKLGKFIKKLRQDNNLTQNDLAQKLGVTYQAVSKWENGKNIPDIAILQEISKLFSVNIDELLSGAPKKKNKKKMILLVFFIIVIIIFLIFYIGHNHSFEFKRISSTCENFLVTGSAAYNKEKSSIYISDIKFCGEDKNRIYKYIECTLYEKYENKISEIQVCKNDNNKNISLENYLENTEIIVENYSSMCKKFSSSNLYLEINAYENDNKFISYKIPINLEDNCVNED